MYIDIQTYIHIDIHTGIHSYMPAGITALSEIGTSAAPGTATERSLLGGGLVEPPAKVDPKAQVGGQPLQRGGAKGATHFGEPCSGE